VSLARPLTHRTTIWITTFVLTNTAVRLKTRHAPPSIVELCPAILSTGLAHLWAATAVAWTSSVRWLFDTRGTDSERLICCAGERGEPGETTTLSIESLLRCEVIPAHPYPPALAQLHRRLYYCTLRTGRTIRHCSCPTVTRHSSHRLDRTILFAVTATRART
jgi:hypothetical protein